MRIDDVDKNFKVETKIKKSDIRFYNAEAEPFKIYGVFKENGKFRRMPEETARAVSDKVYFFHANTAGGRVRFKTSSPYLAIVVKMEKIGKMSHFALTGSAGFDMYVNGVYYRSFVPPFNIADGRLARLVHLLLSQ